MPSRFKACKPDVVSVTRWPTMRDTIHASIRIPTRRVRDERYPGPAAAKREPTAMSASPRRTGAMTRASWPGSCWPSPSTRTARSYPCSYAKRKPVWTAPPMPRLNGSRRTSAPLAAATAAVRSTDPSATTTTSRPGSNALSSSMRPGSARSSFSAGTIATRRSSARPVKPAAPTAPASVSDTGACRNGKAEKVGHAACAMRVRVLVEQTRARAPAELLGLSGIREQLAVDRGRLVGIGDDAKLALGVEPLLEAGDGIRDDHRSAGGELEHARCRRRLHARVRAPRDVEIDPCGGDRVREDVERDATEHPRAAGVAAIVVAADGEVDVREAPAGLADQLAHPLAAELVRVAVEEDVDLLRSVVRPEELGVGRPVDRLCASRAEL